MSHSSCLAGCCDYVPAIEIVPILIGDGVSGAESATVSVTITSTAPCAGTIIGVDGAVSVHPPVGAGRAIFNVLDTAPLLVSVTVIDFVLFWFILPHETDCPRVCDSVSSLILYVAVTIAPEVMVTVLLNDRLVAAIAAPIATRIIAVAINAIDFQ
jgi:hypothetical protein